MFTVQKRTSQRERSEYCAVLGYCAASSGNSLPTLRDKLSVPSSRDYLKMGLIVLPESSVMAQDS